MKIMIELDPATGTASATVPPALPQETRAEPAAAQAAAAFDAGACSALSRVDLPVPDPAPASVQAFNGGACGAPALLPQVPAETASSRELNAGEAGVGLPAQTDTFVLPGTFAIRPGT
jgi:hypothetical protein